MKRFKICLWLCAIQIFKDLFSAIVCMASSLIIIIGLFMAIILIVKDLSIALDILTGTIFVSILLFFAWDLISDSWKQAGLVMNKMKNMTFAEIEKIDATYTFTKL